MAFFFTTSSISFLPSFLVTTPPCSPLLMLFPLQSLAPPYTFTTPSPYTSTTPLPYTPTTPLPYTPTTPLHSHHSPPLHSHHSPTLPLLPLHSPSPILCPSPTFHPPPTLRPSPYTPPLPLHSTVPLYSAPPPTLHPLTHLYLLPYFFNPVGVISRDGTKIMVGKKMVMVTKLLNDLSFWAEVER